MRSICCSSSLEVSKGLVKILELECICIVGLLHREETSLLHTINLLTSPVFLELNKFVYRNYTAAI